MGATVFEIARVLADSPLGKRCGYKRLGKGRVKKLNMAQTLNLAQTLIGIQ